MGVSGVGRGLIAHFVAHFVAQFYGVGGQSVSSRSLRCAFVRRRWRLALALAVLPVLKYVVEFGVVKQTVYRARPFQSVCAEDLSCGQFRDVPLYGPAFVSGHAIIAGAVAAVLLPYLSRRWSVVVVLLAVGVGLARVYLGAHNPLDVVGGIAVGVVIGSLLNLVIGVPADPSRSGPQLDASRSV